MYIYILAQHRKKIKTLYTHLELKPTYYKKSEVTESFIKCFEMYIGNNDS